MTSKFKVVITLISNWKNCFNKCWRLLIQWFDFFSCVKIFKLNWPLIPISNILNISVYSQDLLILNSDSEHSEDRIDFTTMFCPPPCNHFLVRQFRWSFYGKFFILKKDPITKIYKSTPNYLKFSHVVEIDKINTWTKLESILTIFERFRQLWNIEFRSYCFIYVKTFNFQIRFMKLEHNPK